MKLHINNWGLIAFFAAGEQAGTIKCVLEDGALRTYPMAIWLAKGNK